MYWILSFSPLQQTQFPNYAELIVKFLDALIDTYLPGIDEETSEEGLRTPTSPYPPPVQSQLSITANLNLSNSMTSLATSQHGQGLYVSTSALHSWMVASQLCLFTHQWIMQFLPFINPFARFMLPHQLFSSAILNCLTFPALIQSLSITLSFSTHTAKCIAPCKAKFP